VTCNTTSYTYYYYLQHWYMIYSILFDYRSADLARLQGPQSRQKTSRWRSRIGR
jgi:hypothetical protein